MPKSHENKTKISMFILLGINGARGLNISLYHLFLLLYILTLCVNVFLIVLFLVSPQLKAPMYFFLSHLSLADILFSTSIVPSLLSSLLRDGGESMLVASCITQFFTSGTFTGAECFILSVMAYDRYLAICRPLQYINIMNKKLCITFITGSWLLSLLLCLIGVILVYRLDFCGYNIIDYIYCDLAPLLDASCSDTSLVERVILALSIPLVVLPFMFIVFTYVIIFLTILGISSTSGRRKAFSTCSSHLSVVCTYYGILIAKYIVPSRKQSINMNKAISLLYTLGTPLLNPIIYCFRNQVIQIAVSKWIIIKREL